MRWNASDRYEPDHGTAGARPALHVCRVCGEPFAAASAILEVLGRGRYVVELRCASCGIAVVAVEDEERLEALDRELDRQAQAIADAAAVMATARETAAIEAFADALARDRILPEDF
jgi:hypothetical protein